MADGAEMGSIKTAYEATDALVLDPRTCATLVEEPAHLRLRLKKMRQRHCVAFLRYLNTYGSKHETAKVDAARVSASIRITNLMRSNFQRATRRMGK